MNNVIENIRKGEIDINNQDLFFSILIKGLLLRLDDDIKIRNHEVPHFILHTGDDTMYLNFKGYNFSKEPIENTNEEYIYNIIPRCIVNPNNIDVLPDQLSSPYSMGTLQYQSKDDLLGLVGEFRRMPIKLSCDMKYYVDSYTDMLALIQQIISKLSFVRTYNINYMGQTIVCSYTIPQSFQEEHTMDIDGTTTDNKNKTLSLSIEIETSFPIWNPQTIMSKDIMIIKNNVRDDGIKIYNNEGIENKNNIYEIG